MTPGGIGRRSPAEPLSPTSSPPEPAGEQPVASAGVAPRIAREALAHYCSSFSKKDFTEQQLLTILIPRQSGKAEHRGLCPGSSARSGRRRSRDSNVALAPQSTIRKSPFRGPRGVTGQAARQPREGGSFASARVPLAGILSARRRLPRRCGAPLLPPGRLYLSFESAGAWAATRRAKAAQPSCDVAGTSAV